MTIPVPDELLRPALELAWAVAYAGSRQRPAVPPPPELKPFLKFQKLPAPALGPVRRAVDGDEEFRARVAEVAADDRLGRASYLWLVRPAGWETDLELLAIEAAAAIEAQEGERAERDARKRVDAAEQAERAARAEAAAAHASLRAERDKRQEAEGALAKLKRRVEQLEIELGGARRRLDEATEALGAAVAAADAARSEAAQARQAAEIAREAGLEAEAQLVALRQPPPLPAPPAAPAHELGAAAAALREAAAATTRLSDALAAAAASLGAGESTAAPVSARRARRGVTRHRRRPLPLPGGVFADTPEAALHLLRVPRVLLVVDGYNMAKLGWPDVALAEQRARLLDALDELTTRFGTDVQVVFDGADVEPMPGVRRQVRVSFSPAGVTADRVIVDLAASLPADVPVVVATNDGEVRRGASAAGANLLWSEQLLNALRRG